MLLKTLLKYPGIIIKCLSIILLVTLQTIVLAQVKPLVFTNGEVVIRLKDDMKNPFYWWPVTLLQYQIQLNGEVNTKAMSLTEIKTGSSMPFQLSEPKQSAGGEKMATLSFLSDLPSYGDKTFILKKNPSTDQFPGVTTEVNKDYITIKTNKLTVQIPCSQQVTGKVPGPVMQVSLLSAAPTGNSSFVQGKKVLQNIITENISSGPVFSAYRIAYQFKDGASYVATVKCINDYDFVELAEEMNGIQKSDSVSWKMNWTGFSPTHRQAPNHPYGAAGNKPGFARYDWETIDQKKLNYHHGIMPDEKEAGKIPFEVGIYEPWPAERTLSSTLFWDEKKNQSRGVFITDISKWNDSDYAIWHSSKILSIRFYHKNGLLIWQYPISDGSRSTAISCYPHQKDIEYMNDLEEKTQPVKDPYGFSVRTKMSQLSYNTFLQNRFGTIHLDKVKNWDLTYPDSFPLQPIIFKNSQQANAAALAGTVISSGYNTELTISGTRQNSGYGPTSSRQFSDGWVNAFNRFFGELNKEQKARTAATYLFHAYVAADEEYMPMKHMLSGHPNFLADVKTIPALAGFQFPKHPEAGNWADLFEKYLELNTRYHTRPSVKAWNATGGRWTENLGTYVWAFLRPTLRTGYVLQQSENGRNRIAGPGVASVGNWILNALSAPYNGESLQFYQDSAGKLERHYWGIVTDKEGPRRVHPPQGAHAERRKPARSLWLLGSMLNNYDPLLAENLRYVSKPTDDDMEEFASEKDPFNIMYPATGYDRGTKPDLKSIKLTGYGNILRAGLDTKDELSIHLSQIDEGNNYRLGTAGQGGSGMIFFYAGGKSYSHNGREDVGDRKLQDTDLLTSFGVYKDGQFKSIGQNVLNRPLYNLGLGQFAEVVSNPASGYSWPDYQSRSIMLVGSDYFITYDDVYNKNIGSRFSWFTHPNEDLPEIHMIKAGAPREGFKKTKLEGDESKGVWYDMLGDCMAFVSHKKGFKVEAMPYGAKITTPADETDFIFRNDLPAEVNEAGMVFSGTAGFMRVHQNREKEIVLFHGSRIGDGNFAINTNDNDAGISARIHANGLVNGRFYNLRPTRISFTGAGSNNRFYVDGAGITPELKEDSVIIHFPAGEHSWQISKGMAVPVRPTITYSENDRGNVWLTIAPAMPGISNTVQLSNDYSETWKDIGETSNGKFLVKAHTGLNKAHVRVVARNSEHRSDPSASYPVYFTASKPAYPDGLKVTPLLTDRQAVNGRRQTAEDDTVSFGLTWGKVLGVSGYKVYRRKAGEGSYQQIYSGNANALDDKIKPAGPIYEYVVSSFNKNGESVKSNPVSTDPASWLRWDPQPGEKFRRTNTRSIEDKSLVYYPE